jgi:glutathione peroxidase
LGERRCKSNVRERCDFCGRLEREARLCAAGESWDDAEPIPASRAPMDPIYEIELSTIDGRNEKLGAFAGKVMLVVNVASQCGFTPQYEGLEVLHRRYCERGLAVLGFPCDQFGHQEPGDEAAIKSFCDDKYAVTFPLFAKAEVNGENAHPLFRLLKSKASGLLGTSAIKWNFTKFLIDRRGEQAKRYAPIVRPSALARDIERLLAS